VRIILTSIKPKWILPGIIRWSLGRHSRSLIRNQIGRMHVEMNVRMKIHSANRAHFHVNWGTYSEIGNDTRIGKKKLRGSHSLIQCTCIGPAKRICTSKRRVYARKIRMVLTSKTADNIVVTVTDDAFSPLVTPGLESTHRVSGVTHWMRGTTNTSSGIFIDRRSGLLFTPS